MKIEGPGRTNQTSSTTKKDKAAKSAGGFSDMLTGGVQENSETTAPQSIAQVDVLLAAQGAEDPAARASRGRMRQRAGDLLTVLETIRLALLTGNLTVGHVINIADVVASHREKINDPQLTGILDEIDLRAQIEIAKMRKSMDKGI